MGTKTPMSLMITALLASEITATMEIRSGYSILPYASSGLINGVFTINNKQCSYSKYDKSISDFFF